jgi:hypothetical protein
MAGAAPHQQGFRSECPPYLGLGYEVDREEPFMNGVTVHMSKKLHSPAIEP